MNICGAKTNAGTPCKGRPMANGRCRVHGGLTPTGPALPQYKNGRYSKILPGRMADTYKQAMADAALLELRNEVALVDARVIDLLGRVDSGESGEVWRKLRVAFTEFNTARAGGKVDDMQVQLSIIEGLIERGLADYAAWQDITMHLEQRRRLVESERKRMIEMQQMITTEQAMALLAAVVDTVRKHVTDRSALAAISTDIRNLITVNAG